MNESTLIQLYQSAVKAFPNTTKRQHATQPIRIVEMRWLPFLGVNTLFLGGKVESHGKNYDCIILFKEVDYKKSDIKIVASDGQTYSFGKLGFDKNEVNLRCNCPDFSWRFNYYNFVDHSLYGNKRKKYVAMTEKRANPMKMPGICKHLIRFSEALLDADIISMPM